MGQTTQTTEPLIRTELRDRVAVLKLDRPKQLNALSTPLVDRLDEELNALRAERAIRAVVLTGEGRGFSAGADLAEIGSFAETSAPSARFRDLVGHLTEVFQRLQEHPLPSVAALHGFAYGGGLELSLACDLRVAERGTQLGVPEMKLGVLPGAGGTQRLPRMIAPAVARQMILTGQPIDAERAHTLGLVNELAEPGRGLDAALALAETLAAGAPLALAAGKRLVDAAVAGELRQGVGYERETVSVLHSSRDSAEGLQAFQERREPRFTGE
ncbi:enoyl-CoA hydratase/isomerase family protein [Streptomyces sp. KL116D]|uniref:enoyl-CoA hydratase/isomerase family protein n=1 Tax=Streptomyces sp. KL116D TaxID=3045152 RepID=UPI003558E0AE